MAAVLQYQLLTMMMTLRCILVGITFRLFALEADVLCTHERAETPSDALAPMTARQGH